ncbi:fructuronate reductase [Pasteurella testudinis DSM 23072]|uniref:Fructuronate reductase n=1 Tax=Pasteurella testudinis DSM 23072 TaxID=1122938 RepID=A0A1W1V875_9PAST|nr:mannitol dehydrogenase family protein [Pasteurella testudinis]SMB89629.1 fructuronate reductase [Pasteurella testudinis DSM 23072]SUB52044.1 Polyol:NADP oxidoreductase [Pasteurella testudinis]
MELSYNGLANRTEWENKGYILPEYNIADIVENTTKNPIWLHLGAGNIFRAFLANLQQRLLNQGAADKGIIVAEGFDYEIIEKAYRPFDNLSIFARLKNDHTVDKIVIGSITESLRIEPGFVDDFARLKAIFTAPSLQMVSLTITEKGYLIKNQAGEYFASVQADFQNGVEQPQSYIGKIVALLFNRFQNGAAPLAVVSMDNMSKNGEKLEKVILEFARQWLQAGFVSADFIDYLNSDKISFPWSMIDKITPRPDVEVQQMLQSDGIQNLTPVVTSKNTYVAPFVNAEELEYLAIEDNFPNGRPTLEKVGVIFTDRATVNKIETMKVTTCLNPIHTGLAIFGCLLGYTSIFAEMRDPDLSALAKRIGYQEGLPVVIDPKIINPKQFIDEVINIRLSNDFIPDTPQRIASDTSQKLSIRFGETIKSYLRNGNDRDIQTLTAIPLVFAGWLRYLIAVDDRGNEFENSPDPLLNELKSKISCVKLGESVSIEILKPILSDKNIFGIDLYEVGLAEKVTQYLNEMLLDKGAVRATLQKYIY